MWHIHKPHSEIKRSSSYFDATALLNQTSTIDCCCGCRSGPPAQVLRKSQDTDETLAEKAFAQSYLIGLIQLLSDGFREHMAN
tara:strand:+ start:2801 stop:3049 length:249 start_codon:yes stop_codon:yes gene_type:complete